MTRAPLARLAGALALVAGTARAAPVPTLDPSGLHPGQIAEVRTVFRGDSIETFSAEIVGVLTGGRTEGDMILARATSERVVRSGVAQGMSGSPVYVEGKLIGALSSGWSFTREPLFGITPIREMLGVLDLPSLPDAAGSSGPA
ncbi:MAG TPA: SpoIVB peptidase S55 domain-containing protein, partial [Candidatus Eisenbacteria bacterium]